MHPRLCVPARYFEPGLTPRGDVVGPRLTFDETIEACGAAGIQNIGLADDLLSPATLETASSILDANHVRVAYVHTWALLQPTRPASWSEANRRASEMLRAAHRLGARCATGLAGGRFPLSWEDAADAFCRGVAPTAHLARGLGIPLAIEPVNLYFADVTFTHSLRDTLDLAERADLHIVVDTNHCGAERHLRQVIEEAGPRIAHVQISDLIPERHERFRAVPGDGVYPIEEILEWVFATGYDGYVDLELSREPDVPAVDTVLRASEVTARMLERIGV